MWPGQLAQAATRQPPSKRAPLPSRQLEYAFRTVFDQSPRDYLQTLRLNAIHRTLRRSERGGSSVMHIALDHGVTHLGRFAANYRALFGEKPSETKRGRFDFV